MQQQIISKCFVRKLKRARTVIQEKDAIADYFKVRKLKRAGTVIQEKDAIADYFKVFGKEIKASWGSNSREIYNSRLFQSVL